jgi:hypothetical protein
MKSRITIEVDFENGNQPVIQILQTSDSTDVRDKLLSAFCQQFGGSSWCTIKWVSQAPDNPNQNTFFNRIHITPIRPEQFKEQAKIMLEQHLVNEKYKNGRT